MGVFTDLLWQGAIEATKTANNSLKETRRAVNEGMHSNNIAEKNYNISKAAFDSSISSSKVASENERKSFELRSKSVAAQIQSLKETQKQFEVANEPYLQYRKFKLPKLEIGKPRIVDFSIENLGNYPVKIYRGKNFY